MPALAAAGPAEGVKVIEAKVLEVPAPANAMGPDGRPGPAGDR